MEPHTEAALCKYHTGLCVGVSVCVRQTSVSGRLIHLASSAKGILFGGPLCSLGALWGGSGRQKTGALVFFCFYFPPPAPPFDRKPHSV